MSQAQGTEETAEIRIPDPAAVLACEMGHPNDAEVDTVGEYLTRLLLMVWEEREGFDGKRPFGNSSWEYEVYDALAKGGLCLIDRDGDGYSDGTAEQYEAADLAIRQAIEHMGRPS